LLQCSTIWLRRANRAIAFQWKPGDDPNNEDLAGAGGFFEERLGRPTGSITGEEANEIRRRHGWEIIGPSPF
jgi:hypothetical protein